MGNEGYHLRLDIQKTRVGTYSCGEFFVFCSKDDPFGSSATELVVEFTPSEGIGVTGNGQT